MLAVLLATTLVYTPSPHRSAAVTRAFRKAHPCPATGQTFGKCPGYVIDHTQPLCAGGPDAVTNMAWQALAESKKKDAEERRLCAALKVGKLPQK